MTPTLDVIDKDSFAVGRLPARVGLHTYAGVISRVSERSIWVKNSQGHERLYRSGVQRLPSLLLYRLGKADRIKAGIVAPST